MIHQCMYLLGLFWLFSVSAGFYGNRPVMFLCLVGLVAVVLFMSIDFVATILGYNDDLIDEIIDVEIETGELIL